MINQKLKIFLIVAVVIVFIGIILSAFALKMRNDDFIVDAVLLKSTIKQEEYTINNIHITSFSSQNFKAHAENLDDFVSLSENEFNVKAGQIKDLAVKMSTVGAEPGVYVGALVIETEKERKAIPVVLDIQSQDVLFAVNVDVAPDYKEVLRGQQVSVSVKSYNLYDTKPHPVEMDYVIKDLAGRDILFERENVVVGTETISTKTVVVPKDTISGDYIFSVVAKYNGSVGTSSYLFSVVNSKSTASSVSLGFDFNYFALIIFLFLFGIIALVIYSIKDRARQFVELEKRHSQELRFIAEQIEKKRRMSLESAKNEYEKKKIDKAFRKIEERAVEKVKQRYKKRKSELEKLKKQNKKNEMKQKVERWKRQGFDVDPLLSKISKPVSRNDIEEQLRKWRKQGYDTVSIAIEKYKNGRKNK